MSSKDNHASWRKSILIPFWVVQILFLCFMFVIASIATRALVAMLDSTQLNVAPDFLSREEILRRLHIETPLVFSITGYSFATTIIEVVLLALRRLKPAVFVALTAINTVVWTFLLARKIAVLGRHGQNGGLIFVYAILAVSFCVPFVYGCVVWHQVRKAKKAYNEASATLSVDTPDSTQYCNLASRDMNDEENVPLAVEKPPTYSSTRDPTIEDFEGDRGVSPRYEAQGQVSFVTNHSSPHLPTINIQHDSENAYEMGSGKNGEIR